MLKKMFLISYYHIVVILYTMGVCDFGPSTSCVQGTEHGNAFQDDVKNWARVSAYVVGQSQTDLEDVKTPETKEIFGTVSKEVQDNGNARHLQTPLDQKRKRDAEIAKKMAEHRGLTRAMHIEWQELGWWIHSLQRDSKMLKQYGRASRTSNVLGTVNELEEYHRSIKILVQDALRNLGGLKAREFTVKRKEDTHIPRTTVKPNSYRESRPNSTGEEAENLERNSRKQTTFGRSAKVPKLNIKDSSKTSFHHLRLSEGQQKLPNSSKYVILDGDPVSRILDRWKDSWLAKFSKLLHSIHFPNLKKKLNSEAESSNRRQIKVCWEKCVFKSVNYMYKFGVINKEHLKPFFTKETALITGRHLADLFQIDRKRFPHDIDFIPHMHFIKTHWLSEHLYAALSAIEENFQAHVIYSALQVLLSEFHFHAYGRRINKRHKFFVDEVFLETLETWKTDALDDRGQQLNRERLIAYVGNIIDFFQNNIAYPFQNLLKNNKDNDLEYLFTYYILSFLKTYHSGFLQDVVKGDKYATLEKQLLLIEIGQDVHQLIHVWYDYSYFLGNPDNELHQISEQLAQEKLEDIRSLLKAASRNYFILKDELVDESKTNEDIRKWFNRYSPLKNILYIADHEAGDWERHIRSSEAYSKYLSLCFVSKTTRREPEILYKGIITPWSSQ